jgi:aerobic-type carbon monoxide dehydrogenase small subunit (CoxS/CutS family)
MRQGGKLFNLWKDAAHPRGLWRTKSLESFRTDAPNWNVLLDVDALAEKEGEDWALHGATILPGPLERTILKMSRGGTDAVVMREFDNTTRAFVDEGFNLPEAKGGCAWLDGDTLLLFSGLGEGMASMSLAAMQDGKQMTTIEGLERDGTLHPLQAAFIEHDALQCGFCTSSQIMSGVAMIEEAKAGVPSAATADLRRAFTLADLSCAEFESE